MSFTLLMLTFPTSFLVESNEQDKLPLPTLVYYWSLVQSKSATIFLVANGYGADWTRRKTAIEGVVSGQIVDWIWMVFNAVLPLGISIVRQRGDPP